MNWNNVSIGRKLGLAFGALLLLMAATVAIGFMQMNRLIADGEEVATDYLPSIETAGRINTALGSLRQLSLRHVQTETAPGKSAVETKMHAAGERLGELFAQYEKLISSEAERETFDRLRQEYANYLALQKNLFELSNAAADGSGEVARAYSLADPLNAFERTAALAQELVDINSKLAAQQSAQARSDAKQARMVLVSALALAIVAGIALAVAITRSIVRPAEETLRAVERIAGGDLTVKLDTGRGDEMGQIQQALDRMTASLQKLVVDARSATDSISTASSQIASGSQDLSSRTEQAASSLQQTASSMEQL
ncbi:methyl-accepting chemotaxis protein, partial [Caldimonas tepidiphila]|uniref:methyl-accepting chemotaxis protein n=1 Tax=Caldimonas tepidiphila TaxID=2315841 RepID=UPI000E5AEBFE